MPYSFEIPLDVRFVDQLPEISIPALHATFFQWLERGDKEVAKQVHDVSDPKPYTVSPLVRGGEEAARFRITLLDDALWEPLERGMNATPQVRILWATLPLAGPPTITQRTYAQLAQEASSVPVVVLAFKTPMSFRSHEMHYPLPDPEMVFASYHARWNAFAPELLQIDETWLEWLRESVAVSRFELHSEVVRFKKYTQIGCAGSVLYEVVANKDDRNMCAVLNALADYAFFCGTGHKTTQGLGQTQRLARWPENRADA